MSHKIVASVTKETELQLLSDNGEALSGLTSTTLNCPSHKNERYTNYCYTDKKLICDICAVEDPNAEGSQGAAVTHEDGTPVDKGHKGHQLKPLDKMLEQILKEK